MSVRSSKNSFAFIYVPAIHSALYQTVHCPECDGHGMVYFDRERSQDVWKCLHCGHEIYSVSEADPAMHLRIWELPWEIVLAAIVLCLLIASMTVFQSELQSDPIDLRISTVPRFEDLR